MSDVDEPGAECDAAVPTAALHGAVEALRAPVAVRGEWRDALLREAAALPAPRITAATTNRYSRGGGTGWLVRAISGPSWVLSPAAGIAAALLCAALGAGAAWGVMRRATSAAVSPVVTDAGSAMAGASAGVAAPAGWAVPAVRFALLAPGASRVALVGDFNGWNPAATPLRESPDGHTWSVAVPLAPGRHVYAFVVDGSVTADPAAPRAAEEDFGAPSSVVMVAEATP